ncbi:hypothetical protein D3C73_1150230 [compost metagenome]
MVQERLARYKHPWHVLREEGNPEHVQALVLAFHCQPDRAKHREDSGPPDQRIPHGDNAAHLTFRQAFPAAEEPYRTLHKRPFPPGGGERMRSHQLAVVVIHIFLGSYQSFNSITLRCNGQHWDKG